MSDPVVLESGLSRRAVECAAALLCIGIAGLALWDSLERGARWTPSGPESGYFPARVGAIMMAASLFALANALRRPDSIFVTWTGLKRVAAVFIPLILYVAAIGELGIYVASAFFMAAFMAFLGSFRWWMIVAAALVTPLLTFWVFEVQFLTPLPKGPLENWLGY